MKLDFSEPVLLVEDTPSLSMVYQAALERAGLKVNPVFSAREALSTFRAQKNRLVLLDLMLPDGNGIDILKEIHTTEPNSKVVVITANGSINRAVEAMRGGAFDFLVKPFDDRRLLSAVENAIKSMALDAADAASGNDLERPSPEIRGFVGTSAKMRQIYAMVRNIGRSTATVFITGESGTGKEIAAQAIHDQSTRRSGPFVVINCGAIPKDLLESEVFGHLKGSFTGAISDKIGAGAAADGGTLFLDEICEMDLALQTKLLRFLQTSMVQPVGAVEPRKVDVRIVCATNRDPAEEVRAGRFREDLYYRLHVVPIQMPPLRERGQDVLEIADQLLSRYSKEEAKRFRRITQAARDALLEFPWPGNVRQLENVLRNAVVLHDGDEITLDMLPPSIFQTSRPANSGFQPTEAEMPADPAWNVRHLMPDSLPQRMNGISSAPADIGDMSPGDMLRGLVGATLADLEREFIEVTIQECDGSIPRAARILDVSPSTLYRKREAWARTA
ncbi:MAG: sigma-54 dependent transcriptional regulator [Pseudomonadota bacterium]